MKFEFLRNKINSLKGERFIDKNTTKQESFKPIRACLVDSSNIDKISRKIFQGIEEKGLFINWHENKDYLEKNKLVNGGEWTYVISASDNRDKYSHSYCDCTGIVVIGEDKNSSSQLSFISHQDPKNFLGIGKEKFTDDLIEAIKQIKNKTKNGTIDAVVFGGKKGQEYKYKESIDFISQILFKELNFQPVIMTGPNMRINDGSTNVYLDTQNRRLYIARPLQESIANESYTPDELDKKNKDW